MPWRYLPTLHPGTAKHPFRLYSDSKFKTNSHNRFSAIKITNASHNFTDHFQMSQFLLQNYWSSSPELLKMQPAPCGRVILHLFMPPRWEKCSSSDSGNSPAPYSCRIGFPDALQTLTPESTLPFLTISWVWLPSPPPFSFKINIPPENREKKADVSVNDMSCSKTERRKRLFELVYFKAD